MTRAELDAWRKLSYADLAYAVLAKFITDIPAADLKAIVGKTYTTAVYSNGRADSDFTQIAPLRTLEEGLHILELSNGPTLAFKDMAMQLLGNLFEYALGKQHAELNILGATSGDTGSAAEYAMRGKRGIRVFMLSPHGKMSSFQRAQMYSLQNTNIFNIAITGMFDDAQDMVKAISNDHAFKAKYRIGTVNSINWARVSAQIVYYFKGYFAATQSNDEQVAFSVPSGNFGNICAGHIARMMGLPIGQLILATNENDVLDEFFRTGVYRPRDTRHTYETSSPSMDISKAANFERFVFDLVGRDGAKVREFWSKVDEGGCVRYQGNRLLGCAAEIRIRFRQEHAPGPAQDHPQAVGGLWRDDRPAYRRRHQSRTGTAPPQPASDLPGDRAARQVRGDDTGGAGARTRAPRSMVGIENLPQRCEVMDADVAKLKPYIAARVPA